MPKRKPSQTKQKQDFSQRALAVVERETGGKLKVKATRKSR
jgi:hypothetical protein